MHASNISVEIRGVNAHYASCLKQLVKEVNNYNLTIYSYAGDEKHEPIYYEEIDLFRKMVEKANLNCPVIEICDAEFFPNQWNPKNSLLYIPGAPSSKLDLHLGSKVTQIQEFVNQGGRFIGWCGGGYWACREVQYRIDETTILHKIRNLAFWKGMEKGPLLPLKHPERGSEYSHETVKVKWAGSELLKKYLPQGLELNVLLSGGGSFIPADEEHCYKVIATYGDTEKEKALAGVKIYVMDGIAILMNPYFIYGAEYFKSGLDLYERELSNHNWSKIISDLEGEELKSTLCFVDMLLEATQKSISS